MFGTFNRAAQTPETIAAARAAVNAPTPVANVGRSPLSGAGVPIGQLGLGAAAGQGQQLTSDQQRRLIANALSGSQQVQNPLQGVAMMLNTLGERNRMMAQNSGFPQAPKTMGNILGLANLFRAPTTGGGLY